MSKIKCIAIDDQMVDQGFEILSVFVKHRLAFRYDGFDFEEDIFELADQILNKDNTSLKKDFEVGVSSAIKATLIKKSIFLV